MKVVILGKGAFGTAIHSVISRHISDVIFWQRGEAIPQADILIIAVPTQAIRDVLKQIQHPHTSLPIIINCSKGIERDTNLLPYQIVQDVLGADVQYFSLMGPSFSSEVMHRMPTLVNLCYAAATVTEEEREHIKRLFQTNYFHVRLTDSVLGVELAGALKNVYAIASGMSQGLGFGLNTRAKLVGLIVEEILLLCETLQYPVDQHALPAIIGDIVLTCMSSESRNFSFGERLAQGTVDDALQRTQGTVEGYATVDAVVHLTGSNANKLPLARLIMTLLEEEDTEGRKKAFQHFFERG